MLDRTIAFLPLILFVFIVMVSAVAALHFADPHHIRICWVLACR